jgi:hypothetical protein
MAAEMDDLLRDLEMRPRIYATLYASNYTIMRSTFKSQENIVTSLLNNVTDNNLVGAVQRIAINTSRDAEYRRELNTNTAGRPVEVVPGLPSYNLELERVVLYNSTMAQAFSYNKSYDIMKQNRPLMIYINLPGVKRTQEDGTFITTGAKTILAYGVWLQNNNMSFSVDNANDMMIIQNTPAVCTGIISTKMGAVQTTV